MKMSTTFNSSGISYQCELRRRSQPKNETIGGSLCDLEPCNVSDPFVGWFLDEEETKDSFFEELRRRP